MSIKVDIDYNNLYLANNNDFFKVEFQLNYRVILCKMFR